MSTETLTTARALVERSKTIIVLSGSGLSAASGLATFRGDENSLWHRQGEPGDAYATPERWLSTEHFRAHPRRLWDWHLALLAEYRRARPNPGHLALADLQRQREAQGGSVRVYTQNIDTLHEQAGTSGVQHLHGRLDRWRSLKGEERGYTADTVPLDSRGNDTRPDVVFFGDQLPGGMLEAAVEHVVGSDLMIVVGSSLAVGPVNTLPLYAARADVPVLYVGPERPVITFTQLHLRGNAETLLPQVIDRP